MNKEQKKPQEKWENIFFRVYGEPIVKLYEDLWRLRNPGKTEGNIGFEGGMDFYGMMEAFIRTNFIAKRDLRKLLEEKKTDVPDDGYKPGEITSIVAMGPYRAYNQAIDDILAEIENL